MMVSSKSESRATKWPPRIVIGAPQGRSGKTIVSIGLCAALRRRGLAVQPFKKGPDYIDPSWLSVAAGRACRNLDSTLMPDEALLTSFQQTCLQADVALIEGAMGLFDQWNNQGSTAYIARLLRSPVILVVNASRMTHSIAAMVSGYQNFEPETDIAGVVINNVANRRHEAKLVNAVEQHCGIPVVGIIPRDANLIIVQRHLGLLPFPENKESEAVINRIEQALESDFDIDRILDIARTAEAVDMADTQPPVSKKRLARIGVIHDRVFNFYYPENLEALVRAGGELVYIDSVRDGGLPDIDGLYIGGGFPELFLEELEANFRLRRQIAEAIEEYLPVYAECAGLMYLCQGIRWRDKRFEMVGLIPAEVEISPKPQGHGYVMLETTDENPLLPPGLTIWGHEFHHSRLAISGGVKFGYRIKRGHGIDGQVDGIVYKNVFAAYTHLHALGVPQWAEAFISLAAGKRQLSSPGSKN